MNFIKLFFTARFVPQLNVCHKWLFIRFVWAYPEFSHYPAIHTPLEENYLLHSSTVLASASTRSLSPHHSQLNPRTCVRPQSLVSRPLMSEFLRIYSLGFPVTRVKAWTPDLYHLTGCMSRQAAGRNITRVCITF